MKLVEIKNDKDLQEYLQSLVDRIENLEKQVSALDTEVQVISDSVFEPTGELDS